MNRETFRLSGRWPRVLALLALTVLSLSAWWLVESPPVTGQAKTAGPSAAVPKPFHQVHVQELNVVCTACHDTAKAPKPGRELSFSVRPGHATCDSCHEDDFKKEKIAEASTATPMCATCHTGKGDALRAFPSGKLTLARFSHVSHVDPHPKLNKAHGGREDCAFCHKVEAASARPAPPGHPECSSCHSGANAARPVLAKADTVEPCLACHALDRVDRNIASRSVAADVPASRPLAPPGSAPAALHTYRDIRPFDHGRHLLRRDGAPIDCATCHQPVLQRSAPEAGASPRPTMRECASCHDNATFVRAEFLIKNCQVCHTVMRASMRPQLSDPVSPPIVHTEGFRAHHEQQARDPDSQCGVCHTNVVNVTQGSCAGCHSAMKPRSHAGLRFSDWPHGRLAALDRKVCTTCHAGDFCTACHTVLPRSHIPLQTFRVGAHRNLATLNLRSCFTCHTFEGTCSKCHRGQLR